MMQTHAAGMLGLMGADANASIHRRRRRTAAGVGVGATPEPNAAPSFHAPGAAAAASVAAAGERRRTAQGSIGKRGLRAGAPANCSGPLVGRGREPTRGREPSRRRDETKSGGGRRGGNGREIGHRPEEKKNEVESTRWGEGAEEKEKRERGRAGVSLASAERVVRFRSVRCIFTID